MESLTIDPLTVACLILWAEKRLLPWLARQWAAPRALLRLVAQRSGITEDELEALEREHAQAPRAAA